MHSKYTENLTAKETLQEKAAIFTWGIEDGEKDSDFRCLILTKNPLSASLNFQLPAWKSMIYKGKSALISTPMEK